MSQTIVPIIPNDQKFVCLSFLSDKEVSTTTGIRIGGVFDTYEKACAHAEKVRELDIYNHVFVGSMGEWLPYDPDATDSTKVKDSDYLNDELNKLMKGRKENQEKANFLHELRKTTEMAKNINTNIDIKNKNKNELEGKLKKAKNEKELQSITNSIENLDSQIKKMEERLAECTTNEQHLRQKIN
jgi:hypothetical protein